MGKNLVGDAHLDVIGLAGEHLQRFVLCFPAVTAYGSVVAVAIESASDAKIVPEIGRLIGKQGGVVKILDQPGAERRRGDAKDHIVCRSSRGKGGL